MKNVVFFYPSFENGGASVVLINLIKYFSKKNIVYLITNKKPNDLKNIKNLRFIINQQRKFLFINDRILSSFFASKELIKLFFKLNKNSTKYFSMQSHFFPVLLSIFINLKITIRVSEDPCGALLNADNRFFAILVTITKIITYNFANKIITNAIKSQNCVRRFLINKDKVILLYNPTLNKLLRKSKNIRKNYILNVGRLCKQKNQITMLKAFYIFSKKNKNYQLFFCGDGPDKKKLKKYAKKLNLTKKVKFFGWKRNMGSIYKNAKLFVLTSYYEGMPNCLIESVNFEIPSISSNVSGANDILLNGDGGLILKINNHEILANKMNVIINNLSKYKKKILLSKKKLHRFTVNIAVKKYAKELELI